MQIACLQFGGALRRVEEAVLFAGSNNALGEDPELLDVLVTSERARAERMCIGDGEFVDDDLAVLQRDLGAGANAFSAGSVEW